MDITLEDVEVAIKVLYEFLKRQRQAQSVLSRLGVGRSASPYGLNFEQIWQMAYQQVMAQKGVNVEGQKVEEPVLTEDDLRRMREIAQKLKNSGK